MKSKSFLYDHRYEDETEMGIHSVFVTASPVLTNEVTRYYTKLSDKIKAEIDKRKSKLKDSAEKQKKEEKKSVVEEKKMDKPDDEDEIMEMEFEKQNQSEVS